MRFSILRLYVLPMDLMYLHGNLIGHRPGSNGRLESHHVSSRCLLDYRLAHGRQQGVLRHNHFFERAALYGRRRTRLHDIGFWDDRRFSSRQRVYFF
jgi:hypothetical protein